MATQFSFDQDQFSLKNPQEFHADGLLIFELHIERLKLLSVDFVDWFGLDLYWFDSLDYRLRVLQKSLVECLVDSQDVLGD